MKIRVSCAWLTLVYIAFTVSSVYAAKPLDGTRTQFHLDRARDLSAELGADHSLRISQSEEDDLGMTHAHFQQHYKGVRVFGGELITHFDKAGNSRAPTLAIFRNININVLPSIKASDAVTIAHREIAPKGAYKAPPTAELIVYPVTSLVKIGAGSDATAYEYQPVSYHLAYIVVAMVERPEETTHNVYVIDANTSAVLHHWNDLHTSASVGTGSSEYSGPVQIDTNSASAGFELRDTIRATVSGTFGIGNVVTNLDHGTSGNGTIYTDSDNNWGDGQNFIYYDPANTTTSANGETAAVDAAYGIQSTWDMYKYVLGRNGIDGAGKSTYARVHYSIGYNDAFWDENCFCMTLGDGAPFTALTSIDVVGHEMSHGVSAHNGHGGLNYSGESGGLNESNSDIMGTMAEFYVLGGGEAAHATTIPTTGGNWTIAEQLGASPLRYMFRPSLDGKSPDAWSTGIENLNVHYSSGPGNRQFYFLSQGASNNSASNFYSPYLPGGMTGIGNDRAARIHYRALTTYYTSNSNYAAARTAHINAAVDLYGNGSAEAQAVQNSFIAINVGPPIGIAGAVGIDVINNGGYPEVWVTGTDGNLWRTVWSGSAWVKENKGIPASGVGIASAVGTDAFNSGTNPEVWLKGTDGNLRRTVWNGSAWVKENHGTPASGVGIASAIGSNVVSGGYPEVFVIGTDGNLWRHDWTGSVWINENLGKPASGVGIASAVGMDVFNGGYPEAWLKGTDGNLWRTVWNGSTWVKENHGTPASGVGIASAIGSNVVSGGYPEVFVIGTDGNLWRHDWTGSVWINENLGKPASGVGIASAVGMDVFNGGYPEAWLKGTDGNLWRTVWNGSTWVKENHGTPASGVGIASAIGSNVVSGGYPEVFVIGTDGNLWRHDWTGSAWINENLGKPN